MTLSYFLLDSWLKHKNNVIFCNPPNNEWEGDKCPTFRLVLIKDSLKCEIFSEVSLKTFPYL